MADGATTQEQTWDPVAELRQRYPGVADESDDKIREHLSDPKNFRSAFPEYAHLDDQTIRRNLGTKATEENLPGSTPLLREKVNQGVATMQPPTQSEKERTPESGQGFLRHGLSVLGNQIGDFAKSSVAPYTEAYHGYKSARAGGNELLPSIAYGGAMGLNALTGDTLGTIQRGLDIPKEYKERREAGYGPVYSAAAPQVAPQVGVNLPSMEHEASLGHTGAVAAEAAVPAGEVAAGYGLHAAIPDIHPFRKISEFAGKTISEEAAGRVPATGQFQPALANSPAEVLNYAASKGIDLTPGQATATGPARTIEAIGERSLVGGQGLEEARAGNAQKLGKNIRDLADRVDPKAVGMSEEAAGESIRQSAETAKQVRHENASAAYDGIDWMGQQKVDPAPISQKWMDLRERLPMGAENQILSQVPRSMRATVEEMLSPTGMKAPLTFDQGIALRSFFRELGETEGLPNSQQGIFRQMSQAVDSSMENAAKEIGGMKEWRQANQGWKDYNSLYGDRQSPLTRILRQSDPAKITRDLLNRASANDIEILNKEGMTSATDALKRQVITDIANRGFQVGGDGLGGYSHSFLNTLLGPEMTKELYLNGDLARRFRFQLNPSGTSNVLMGREQLGPTKWMMPMGAAKTSMPRPAASYLPQGMTAPIGAPEGVLPPIGRPTPFGPLGTPNPPTEPLAPISAPIRAPGAATPPTPPIPEAEGLLPRLQESGQHGILGQIEARRTGAADLKVGDTFVDDKGEPRRIVDIAEGKIETADGTKRTYEDEIGHLGEINSPRAQLARGGKFIAQETQPSEADRYLQSLGREVPEVELGEETGPRANASGQPGGGGLEEQGRIQAENAVGVKYFREDAGGKRTPLIGLGRQDLRANPGGKIIRVEANGQETVLDARPIARRLTRP